MKFAVEKYADVVEDMKPLFVEHWEEISVHKDIPLDPNYEFYKKADEAGLLVIYTVRADAGEMIGYAVFFVRPHTHYQGHVWALNDIVWIHPDYRRTGIGFAFLNFWEDDMRQRGVRVCHINTKIAHPALASLLAHCGYHAVEIGHSKRLD